MTKINWFKDAQQNGFAGNPNFESALAEINSGGKQSHWIWYIIPSCFNPTTDIAKKFAISRKSTPNITDYLQDEYLRNNYIKIISAIYDKLNNNINITKIMGSDIDVLKLNDSLKRFFKPFIDININNQYDKFIDKMKFIIDKIKAT